MLSFFAAASSHALHRTLLASLGLLLPAVVSAQTITAFAPATAPAGSTVAITGLNLSTTTSVVLNGQKCASWARPPPLRFR